MVSVSIKGIFSCGKSVSLGHVLVRTGNSKVGLMSATGVLRALVLSGRLLQNGCLFSCLLCVTAPRGELKVALILIIHHCPCLLGP